jgi:hypothetical protein
MDGRRSLRDRDAATQSNHVAERASAQGRTRASRVIRTPRLSDGIVAEASIMARLLRWRVLTLDASVVVLPADTPPTNAGVTTPARTTRRRRPATRGRLSEAMNTIEQAEHDLARARRTNQRATPRARL